MTWRFLDEVLKEVGFQQRPLGLLKPDCNEYDVMLYQHGGTIVADVNGVFNADQATATAKFTSLFTQAFVQQPQLLVTPEYSCPWSALEQMIRKNHWPAVGNVWVVGCESIRPSELTEFCSRCDMVTWHAPAYAAERDQVFLDIVCICLNATDDNGTEIRLAVLQAKNTAMADGKHLIEPNYLIRGQDRYILRNDEGSIRLALMICSDALEQNIVETLPRQEHLHLPYILLHIQLNPNPRHPGFREYRDFWGNRTLGNVEILCLNWARGTSVFGEAILFGGSAWYLKTDDVSARDTEVNEAHRLGSYYAASRHRHFHCQMLNYDEHVFCLRSSKISQVCSQPPTHRKRTGPRAIKALSWDSGISDWQPAWPDDGFSNSCVVMGVDMAPLNDDGMLPADRERLICLTNAEVRVTSKTPWPHVRSLKSFEIQQSEAGQRVTFCHDPDEDSRERRRLWLQRFATLKNEILGSSVSFPQHLQSLQGVGGIRYPAIPESYSFNVVDPNGEFPSTFVFIGEASDQHARQIMDRISDIVGDAKRSLVVWFRQQNGQFAYVCPSGIDTFDTDLSENSRSILRGTL